jgi:Mg2+ and Co2+ transporter CorA
MDFVRTLRTATAIGTKRRVESIRKDKKDTRKDKMRKLLVAKYQKKFGKSVPLAVINDQVNRFLDSMQLTNHNLEILESRIIATASKVRGKSETKTPVQKPKQENLDVLSDYKQSKRVANMSVDKMKRDYYSTEDSMTEDDEWAAIIRHNNELYQEEMRQEDVRRIKQKRHLRYELDKQIQEKREIQKSIDNEEK